MGPKCWPAGSSKHREKRLVKMDKERSHKLAGHSRPRGTARHPLLEQPVDDGGLSDVRVANHGAPDGPGEEPLGLPLAVDVAAHSGRLLRELQDTLHEKRETLQKGRFAHCGL
jgi:hypothetical protein